MAWVVGKVKPNQDKIAIRNLINQQFNYYQPKILDWKRTAKGMVKLPAPLFPCYLFIEITNRWACLNSTHGLSGVINSSGVPALVSDKVIADLRQREQGGIIQLPKERFAIGDRVRINAGLFAGQEALVDRMSNKERERVLLALLSNKIKVLVDGSALEAA